MFSDAKKSFLDRVTKHFFSRLKNIFLRLTFFFFKEKNSSCKKQILEARKNCFVTISRKTRYLRNHFWRSSPLVQSKQRSQASGGREFSAERGMETRVAVDRVPVSLHEKAETYLIEATLHAML